MTPEPTTGCPACDALTSLTPAQRMKAHVFCHPTRPACRCGSEATKDGKCLRCRLAPPPVPAYLAAERTRYAERVRESEVQGLTLGVRP